MATARVEPNGQKFWELRYKKADGRWSRLESVGWAMEICCYRTGLRNDQDFLGLHCQLWPPVRAALHKADGCPTDTDASYWR